MTLFFLFFAKTQFFQNSKIWKSENNFQKLSKKWKKFSLFEEQMKIWQKEKTCILVGFQNIFLKFTEKSWQNCIFMLKSELWKYFSLFLKIVFKIIKNLNKNILKSENYFQNKKQIFKLLKKGGKFWTGLYYRLSSCITTWVALKRRSLIGCFLTPVRYFLIP